MSEDSAGLSPHTPVLVGVGQASERLGEPGYRALSAADLAAEAVRAAFADSGGDLDALAAIVDTFAAVRAFDDSSPYAFAALGAPDNVPRAIASRLGIDPRRAVLGPTGGQSPQQLLNELSRDIAAGRCEAAVIAGAETISTVRHLAGRPREERPDLTERHPGGLEDRGYAVKGLTTAYAARHNLVDPVVVYSAMENARRARLGVSRADYATTMGALFEPFTAVAARNPHAAAPTERSREELVRVDDRNRLVTDVYPRFLVARDQVNQAAALLLTSLGAARSLGIPADRMVFLHGHADLAELGLLDRPDLDRSPAAVAAVRHGLDMADIALSDLTTLDLYSCFPIAVLNLCDGLELAPDDPRGLTVTGGLPFFGGPGNNYSTHAIAETARRLRAHPGSFGLVAGNGGVLSKHSVGVYSTTPKAWRDSDTSALQAELAAAPTVPVAHRADGWGVIETHVVEFARDGAARGIVIGRLADGRRFVANPDDALTTLLTEHDQPIGQRVFVRSTDAGNRATRTRPANGSAPALRADYDSFRVTASDHILEVLIDRAEAGNTLHDNARRELDEILAAFDADDDLWVAILAGAGERTFCLGMDLGDVRSPLQILFAPRAGEWAGAPIRSRTKPMIAAVNGPAEGAGLALALTCDLVVADDRASFAVTEPALGLPPHVDVLIHLPRLAGVALANDMILSGRRIDRAEALAAGLVAREAPRGKALDLARQVAADIVARSPIALRAALAFLDPASAADPEQRNAALADEIIARRDPSEGFAAHLAGRQPDWRIE
ncbi:acetyl-CoA acetyltransferase [Nocardia takedensis]|uniref:acetyl-CoA acetyltransferase n=1 Tax=Nocardia takedensis TaxID=259390 RepID=UPI0002E1C7DD|nr:acetyl-CoA acetyltransferase [Nocardia takedensis]